MAAQQRVVFFMAMTGTWSKGLAQAPRFPKNWLVIGYRARIREVLGPGAGTQQTGPSEGVERKAFLHSHSLVRVVPWLTGPCRLLVAVQPPPGM